MDEASLTGESDSVAKAPHREDDVGGHGGAARGGAQGAHAGGMLYGGMVITAGKGVGFVVRTGMDTEMGKVSARTFPLDPTRNHRGGLRRARPPDPARHYSSWTSSGTP